jgi:hypothetical protein
MGYFMYLAYLDHLDESATLCISHIGTIWTKGLLYLSGISGPPGRMGYFMHPGYLNYLEKWANFCIQDIWTTWMNGLLYESVISGLLGLKG